MTAPTMATAPARHSHPALSVTAAVVIAVAVNVLLYAGGRAVGGSFRFPGGRHAYREDGFEKVIGVAAVARLAFADDLSPSLGLFDRHGGPRLAAGLGG